MYRKLYPLLVNSQQRYYNLTTRTRKSVCGIQVQLGRKHIKVIKVAGHSFAGGQR